jgi:DNA-binding MarR family transcriptional regulator
MPVVTTEECNCSAVRAAARHVTQFYDQVLAPAGLRTTQSSILARLNRLGPLTINALASDMVMDRTTLGRNILPLERDGLIRIEATPSDRRAKELHLTVKSACKSRTRDGQRPKHDLKPLSVRGARQSCAKYSGRSLQANLRLPATVALGSPTVKALIAQLQSRRQPPFSR